MANRRIETFQDVLWDIFERLMHVLMPSLGLEELRRVDALIDEEKRLVEFSGAPEGYHEIPQ